MADDSIYMPPKPVNPWNTDTCQPCPPPPHNRPPMPGPGPCAPGFPAPPIPGPGAPDCGCSPDPACYPVQPPPGFGQIPPVPSVIEGSSLYEAMNVQVQRVNTCIAQWNAISKNCFEAMNACVAAARANDVYYDECEVKYFQGYDENEGCTYSMVEKKAVDRQGRPIFVKLAPAYDNSTNSGIKQSIFDVSFIKSANMIITAVPVDQANWYGPAMWKGAAIPGAMPEAEEGQTNYVYGFNRHGVLRYFVDTVTQTDLCQNAMVDVIGGCIPILNDGELTTEAQAMTSKAAIQAIGYNKSTGSVFFFTCSAQDNPGMAGVSVAKLLQGYACTTAVITCLVPAADQNETGAMMYMGQMAAVPQGGLTPENLAYWYISKRENFNNRFQKEIADLVQTTGQNAWKNYLLGVQIQSFDDRIKQNHEDIKNEIERAMQAEQWLQENINKEVNRAMQAESWLQENINKEVNRAEAAEQALDEKIEAETTRATQAEQALGQRITDETNRAKTAEAQLASDLNAEQLRAQNRENEIQDALNQEITARINADNDIINSIEQEVLARRAADTALENKIDAVKNALSIDIQNLENTINGITGGQTNLPYLKLTGGTLTGPVTMTTNNTITLGRGPTGDLEAATKKYVDDAIAGGTTPGTDVSKEYVDQQIANVQTQLEGKVSKDGDTMTGALDMDGNEIQNAVLSSNTATSLDNGAGGPGRLTNVATPTADSDAVPKSYVDTTIEAQIESALSDLGDDYLQTAGGQMTGDIDMTGNSVVKFSDPPVTTFGARVRKLAAKVASVIKGSIYNDDDDICVKSEFGHVGLKAPMGVTVTDGEGNAAPLMLGDITLQAHDETGEEEHLDLNVPTDAGAVYINRSANGQVQTGGTGELHVTEIHAPNQLNIAPGTNINLNPGTVVNIRKQLQMNSNEIIGLTGLGGSGALPIHGTSGISLSSNGQVQLNAGTGTISAVNKRIQNVAAGSAQNDAVTVGQLNGAVQNINTELDTTNERVEELENNIPTPPINGTLAAILSTQNSKTSVDLPDGNYLVIILAGDYNTKRTTSASAQASDGFGMLTRYVSLPLPTGSTVNTYVVMGGVYDYSVPFVNDVDVARMSGNTISISKVEIKPSKTVDAVALIFKL